MDDSSSTSSDIVQPLLPTGPHGPAVRSSSTSMAVFNLSKVIIGAGMMAIPRAYVQTGFLVGTAMLLAVAGLTCYSLVVLVQGSAQTGAVTYSQLARLTCGKPIMKLLQCAVLSFCFGFGVVYLVIIRDILLGTPPACNGLLCELGGLDPGSPLADPRLVIGGVAALVVAPLLALRSMDKLAPLNVLGVAAIALLAAVTAGLGIQGILSGTAHPIPLLPQWQLLGPSRAAQLQALTGVAPVLIACYVAHQSVHPLMPLVRPYSDARMVRVVGWSLAMSFGVYLSLSVGGALAFGNDLEVNVLTNLSVSGLQPLVGPFLARTLSWSIRGGYLVSLLASLLLYMHPLRGCLAEVLWADPVDEPPQQTSHHTSQPGGDSSQSRSQDGAQQQQQQQSGGRGVVSNAAGAGAPPSGAAAGGVTAALAAGSSKAGSAFTTPAAAATAAAVAAADAQQDHNVLNDDTRMLVAFDSMDTPAFGSWKPGFMFLKPGTLNPLATQGSYLSGARRLFSFGSSNQQQRAAAAAAAAAAAQAPTAGQDDDAAEAGGNSFLAQPEGQAGEQQQQQHLQRWQQLEQQWYYVLTYGLLAGMVLVAILVPNIWAALSMIGDLASTLQAFVVPGLIALVLASRGRAAAAAAPGVGRDQHVFEGSGSGAVEAPSVAQSNYQDDAKAAHSDRSCSCKLLLRLRCDSDFMQGVVLRGVQMVGGSFLVALGLALFANGIYQRL